MLAFATCMALQPDLAHSVLKAIENGVPFGQRTDMQFVDHGNGIVPVLLRDAFPGDHLLVERGHGPGVEKINIPTQDFADIVIVWLQRPNEILLKCAGTTPSVRKRS